MSSDILPQRDDLPAEIAAAEYVVRRTVQAQREAQAALKKALDRWAVAQSVVAVGERITYNPTRRYKPAETWQVRAISGELRRSDNLRVVALCVNVKKDGTPGERDARFYKAESGEWVKAW